jgi:hypothetical protein
VSGNVSEGKTGGCRFALRFSVVLSGLGQVKDFLLSEQIDANQLS